MLAGTWVATWSENAPKARFQDVSAYFANRFKKTPDRAGAFKKLLQLI